MKRISVALALIAVLLLGVQTAFAQEGETWETQEKVYNVTLIKIHPNMDDKYLNNLKRTWVTGVKEAMKEGLTLDYKILSSITPNDNGYNLILITEHPNLASFDATDEWRAKIARIGERYEAIISDEESDEITGGVYPEIRTILSDKLVREVSFKE
jgi:hypothetical protein